VCRCLPWVLKNYKLEELTSVPELRANVNRLFRRNQEVATPQVVDLLIYKGREELEVRACARSCSGPAATSRPCLQGAHVSVPVATTTRRWCSCNTSSDITWCGWGALGSAGRGGGGGRPPPGQAR
jgi:hypothetical protein